MDAQERIKIARAYVEYASWWVREGSEKHRQRIDGARARFDAELSVINRVGPRGLAALRKVLTSGGTVRSELFDDSPLAEHAAEWAADRVREVITGDAAEGWALIRELARQAPDAEDVLGFIGAGPFEDWVTEERIASVRADLVQGLKSDPKLVRVVAHSWRIPPSLREIWEEVGVSRAEARRK